MEPCKCPLCGSELPEPSEMTAEELASEEQRIVGVLNGDHSGVHACPGCGKEANLLGKLINYMRIGSMSFVDVERYLASEGVETEGDRIVELGYGVVLWAGVSSEFCALLKQAMGSGLVEAVACSPFVYWHDGKSVDLPLAKRVPAEGYKKPHWCPIVFNSRTPQKQS
jgi:hypothetical protein